MTFNISGAIRAEICEQRFLPVSRGWVRIYATQSQLESKETTFLLRPETGRNSENLLAEVQLNEAGSFNAELPASYQNGLLEIDLVGLTPEDTETSQTIPEMEQINLGVFKPEWERFRKGYQVNFDLIIPKPVWCEQFKKHGWWVICGTVLDEKCANPVPFARVTALDTDCLQDDRLGQAITDESGNFCLFYRKSDFTPTVIPGLQHEWGNAPDIYFVVDNPETGFVMLQEPRSRGKEKDRLNAPQCFCVKLCIKNSDPDACKASFARVGIYQIDASAVDGFRIDPATGLAIHSGRDLAFCRTVSFEGNLPGLGTPEAWEYRFLYRNLRTGGPKTPIAGDLIAPGCKIGERFNSIKLIGPFGPYITRHKIADVFVSGTTSGGNTIMADSEGWIKVPLGLDFQPYREKLLCFDTEKVHMPSIDLIGASFRTGESTSVSPFTLSESEDFEITMESRKVGSLKKCYSVLPRMRVNNSRYNYIHHPYWPGLPDTGKVEGSISVAMLDICELNPVKDEVNNCGGGTGCNKLQGHFTIKYTAFHPHLRSAQLSLEGPGASFSQDVTANPSGLVRFSGELKNCTYILWFTTSLNLTSGDGPILDESRHDHIAFGG
ncbi:MAG: hypothetical protein H6581_23710 [Bacteroidia bacterium]|nr:hypothetical protein [Bacteroidia bacterium]